MFLENNLVQAESIFILLSQLLVTFLGVFLAFALNRYIEKQKRREDEKTLFIHLYNELNEIKGKLDKDKTLSFPEIWESVVSSGQMRILDPLQAILITRVYREIKQVEEIQENNRELVEQFEFQKNKYTPDSIEYSKELTEKYYQYQKSQQERRKNLLINIEALLKKKWWREEIRGEKT